MKINIHRSIIHTGILFALLSIFFVGCGEKKSAGVIKCEELASVPRDRIKASPEPAPGYDPKAALVRAECLLLACKHYEGSDDYTETSKWMYGESKITENRKQSGGEKAMEQLACLTP
jgi:hypothetical protein